MYESCIHAKLTLCRFVKDFSRGRVIDPCTFLISSHVKTALIILWIRKRLESQAINKQVIVPIHS